MYSVFVRSKAQKYLEEIDAKYSDRIKLAIKFLSLQPIPFRDYDVKKISGLEDTYRIRIGPYRFVYSIFKKEKSIVVLKIERRDEHTYD